MFRGNAHNAGLIMHVTEGVEYGAYLHSGPIHVDGRACLGICDHRRRIMLVADHLSEHDMLGVLCHEYWHAFEQEFSNFSESQEARADLFAMATRQLLRSLPSVNPGEIKRRLTYLTATVLTDTEGAFAVF